MVVANNFRVKHRPKLHKSLVQRTVLLVKFEVIWGNVFWRFQDSSVNCNAYHTSIYIKLHSSCLFVCVSWCFQFFKLHVAADMEIMV